MQRVKHEEFQMQRWTRTEELSSLHWDQEQHQPTTRTECWNYFISIYDSYHSNCTRLSQFFWTHSWEIGDIHEDIDNHHNRHADQDSSGKILHRLLDLLRYKVELVPAIVVPQSIESYETNARWSNTRQEVQLLKTYSTHLMHELIQYFLCSPVSKLSTWPEPSLTNPPMMTMTTPINFDTVTTFWRRSVC